LSLLQGAADGKKRVAKKGGSMRYFSMMICAALAIALWGPAGLAQKEAKKTGGDEAFLREAASGGMAEVKLGQLAAERAANPDIRKFGQRMMVDHGKMNQDLMNVAKKLGVNVPKELNKTHQALVEKMQGLKGPDFDRTYMQEMVKDHQHDVKEFAEHAKSAEHPDVRALAGRALPIIQEHLRMARELASKVGAGQSR
jgi:putative membrane protein